MSSKTKKLTKNLVSKWEYIENFNVPSPDKITKNITFYTVKYRALSHKELMSSLEYLQTFNHSNLFYINVVEKAMLSCYDNVGNKLSIDDLSITTIIFIGESILDKSVFTEEERNKLDISLNVVMSEDMKGDTWDCEVCRKRRLDRIRNCGFKNELNKKKDFRVVVNGVSYTSCPIYFVDKNLVSSAFLSYNLYQEHLYPDSGGFFDQTNFFVEASLKVSTIVSEKEKKELEELKNKK